MFNSAYTRLVLYKTSVESNITICRPVSVNFLENVGF